MFPKITQLYILLSFVLSMLLSGFAPRTPVQQAGSPTVEPAQEVQAATHKAFLPLAVTYRANPENENFGISVPPAAALWGAYVSGGQYGYTDGAPGDLRALDAFESHAGKKVSILHWGLRWQKNGEYQRFNTTLMDRVQQRGAYSLLDWTSRDYGVSPETDQPAFSLQKIISGVHDAYIRQWATDARNWGHPFFLRFDHDMNGDWMPWSEQVNGNKAGQYVQAWRHVHDIFNQAGASNVGWVWCPSIEYAGTIPLEQLYPGDAYVDWTCIDGYNYGADASRGSAWQTFDQLFNATYHHVLQVAPSKPVMLGEVASSEAGGSKATWISDALKTQLPARYTAIKALVWFNVHGATPDWDIESSSGAQAAFKSAIAGGYYLAGPMNGQPTQTPPPPASTPIPTRTPTPPPAPTATTPPPPSGWHLVWSDEFNGPNGSAPDASKWTHETGGAWGNGRELQYYTDLLSNAYQQNGSLYITARKENYGGNSYTSARLKTQYQGDFKYGRFEVRAILPGGQGIWPAIWLMPTDSVYGGWPKSGEIDIMEMLGQNTNKIYGTAHYPNSSGGDASSQGIYTLPNNGSFAAGFHVFALEWEPTQLRWYVDDHLYYTFNKTTPFDQKFYYILNIAVGGPWPGPPDSSTVFPTSMVVDFARIYQR